MKVYFPNKITSAIGGYEMLLRFHNDLIHLENTSIEISFFNVSWFEANLVAILGAIIENLESKGNIVSIIECNMNNDILTRNGFLTNFGFKPALSLNTTQIPYRKFLENQPHLYNQYIQEELLDKSEFPKHSERLGNEIKRNIYELFENARTHGKCSQIHTCGQFYPQRKKLHITIVDTGNTIINNVRKYLNQDLLSSECIDWAMQSGNTTKTGAISGGLGLGIIFDFINLNQGKIQIISSNGYWELRERKITKVDMNFSFAGTIANLEFDLKDDSIYSFADESFSLDNIF